MKTPDPVLRRRGTRPPPGADRCRVGGAAGVALAALLVTGPAGFAEVTTSPGLHPGPDAFPVERRGAAFTAGGAGPIPAALPGFGSAVVLMGDLAFVGSPGSFSFALAPALRPGRVHVFREGDDGRWVEINVLHSPGNEVGDRFGTALAARGDWLAVGAPGSAAGRGAAHLYRRDDDDWVRVGGSQGATDGEAFGHAVALTDGHLAVGAPGRGSGAVDVYALDAPASRIQVITAEVPQGARFGAALSGSSSGLLIGAPGPGPNLLPVAPPEYLRGSGHLYRTQSVGAFALEATLVPEDGSAGPEAMGWSVALDETRAFLGAPAWNGGSGRVHTFGRRGDVWASTGTLQAEALGPAGLGLSVAWSGEVLMAGAPPQGRILVFEPTGEPASRPAGAAWTQVQQLEGQGSGSFFAHALAVSGRTAIVSAPAEQFGLGAGHILVRGDDGWTAVDEFIDADDELAAVGGELVPCAGEDGGTVGSAGPFPCGEVDLLAFIPASALGTEGGVMVNDVWGWTDPETRREYALVGRSDGLVFVDVTEAATPRILGSLPLSADAVESMWRDMKVYAHHVFVVADAAGAHGIQIFDLRQLRGLEADSHRTFDETARYDEIFSAHNIVINEDTGFAYVVGASSGGTTCGGGLHMVDVRDPVNPTFAGCFQDTSTGLSGTGYSHDAQCILYHGPDPAYEGREICFGANENALSIADVTDKANPVAIASASYPNSAYLHQGWVSEDHRFFFMNDEGDEIAGMAPRTRTLVWDVEELDDPILVTEHLGTTEASDHNLYVRGDRMYQSNYVSGLRILDVSDPANPVEVGYFDTVPQGENVAGWAGSWSNYPFFESGTILVTSLREGLFLVKMRERPAVL